MNHKQEIKELALTVNYGLQTYIAVHNIIHSEAFTSKSLLKNTFGKGVPMYKLLENAEELIPIWNSIESKIENFSSQKYQFLSSEEKHYLELLKNYVTTLQKTVLCLVEQQKVMAVASKNFFVAIRSWRPIRNRQVLYRRAIEEYAAIGQRLNDASHIIFQ